MASSCASREDRGRERAVVLFFGPELMQQPDAVALAAAEDGFHLLPAEPCESAGLTDDGEDGVEAFEPVGVAGHRSLRKPAPAIDGRVRRLWGPV